MLDRAATGPRWLAENRLAQCVVDTLLYGERPHGLYRLRAWVVMANHVHLVMYPEADLSKITQTIKGFFARKANAILARTGPFWQDESYDR